MNIWGPTFHFLRLTFPFSYQQCDSYLLAATREQLSLLASSLCSWPVSCTFPHTPFCLGLQTLISWQASSSRHCSLTVHFPQLYSLKTSKREESALGTWHHVTITLVTIAGPCRRTQANLWPTHPCILSLYRGHWRQQALGRVFLYWTWAKCGWIQS